MDKILDFVKKQQVYVAAGFSLVILLAVILLGIFALKTPIFMAIVIPVLGILLSICLCKSQIWLHIATVVILVILGIVFQFAIFMILVCFTYGAGILTLHLYNKKLEV